MLVHRMFTCILLFYSTCYAQGPAQRKPCAADKHRTSATLCTKEPCVPGQHESSETRYWPDDMLNPSVLHFLGIALATYFIVQPVCS